MKAKLSFSLIAKLAAVLCLSLLLLPLISHADAAKAGWTDDQTKALEKAKTEKKMVLMNFTGSDWCPWCIKMDKEVFDTADFKKYAKDNLILVELDFPRTKKLPAATKEQNDTLAKKYGVEGFPTMVVLDSEGNKLQDFGGYQEGGAKAFIAQLEALKKK